MPTRFPDEIHTNLIIPRVPQTHIMWWIRAVVLAVGQVAVPATGTIHTRVKIGDLDAPGEGYDIVIEGPAAAHDLAEGDIVSIFGHEQADATRISDPRLLQMHNTNTFTRCYPDVIDKPWEHRSIIERKYWLAARVPATKKEKLCKVGIRVLPLILITFAITGGNPLSIVLWPIIPIWLTMLAFYLVKQRIGQKKFAGSPPPKKGLIQILLDTINYRYIDLTDFYEDLANAMHSWVLQHPDTQTGFMIRAQRGKGTQGALRGLLR